MNRYRPRQRVFIKTLWRWIANRFRRYFSCGLLFHLLTILWKTLFSTGFYRKEIFHFSLTIHIPLFTPLRKTFLPFSQIHPYPHSPHMSAEHFFKRPRGLSVFSTCPHLLLLILLYYSFPLLFQWVLPFSLPSLQDSGGKPSNVWKSTHHKQILIIQSVFSSRALSAEIYTWIHKGILRGCLLSDTATLLS